MQVPYQRASFALLFSYKRPVFSFNCMITPPSIAGLFSCNFGELPKVVILSLKMSDVLWWCILQTNPSFFLLPGQVADFIGDPIRVTTCR